MIYDPKELSGLSITYLGVDEMLPMVSELTLAIL
jgi:hypothetical protein